MSNQCVYNVVTKMCQPLDPVSYNCKPTPRYIDVSGNPVCWSGQLKPPVNPPNVDPDGYIYTAGDTCRTSYDCGAYASRGRLRDVDPWSPGANRGVIPEPTCRILSGPDAGSFVNCMDQLDNYGGELACANMDTSAGSDGECVYCPPSTDGSVSMCASSIPDDPNGGGGALSAFRMRTRMSMARFH